MTKNWQYFNPVKVISGAGTLSRLQEFTQPGDWLLITSVGFSRRGLVNNLKNQLSGVTLHVYDGVTPNPELDDLEAVIEQYRNMSLQGIIGLGGGSVIDASKVLAITLLSELEKPLIKVLRQSKKHKWDKKLPLIVIPTTSGTGAEVTPFATVWSKPEHKKYSVADEKVFPDIALLDPTLTVSLPEFETLYTSLDAISHALESLWNVNCSPVSEAFAVQSLNLALTALPKLRIQPEDIDARADMQKASLLAGLAISQTRTAIAHSISYPLTSHFNVPHGIACSFTLAGLIARYLEKVTDNAQTQLLINVLALLREIDIPAIMTNYIAPNQLISLKAEMRYADRLNNYSLQFTDLDLDDLLKKSLFTNPVI